MLRSEKYLIHMFVLGLDQDECGRNGFVYSARDAMRGYRMVCFKRLLHSPQVCLEVILNFFDPDIFKT